MTQTPEEKVSILCANIIGRLDALGCDDIALRVHESWPPGLPEAILEHYGKFGAGRTVDDKIVEIHVKPMSKKRRLRSYDHNVGY